eukprot:UN10118
MPLDLNPNNLFNSSTCHRPVGATSAIENISPENCAVILASSGHYTTTALADTHLGAFDANGDASSPSLINGILIKPTKSGNYPFMASTNNNFFQAVEHAF